MRLAINPHPACSEHAFPPCMLQRMKMLPNGHDG